MAKRTPTADSKSLSQIQALGVRLRAARLRRRLTQADLAAEVDVAVPTVRKLEAGDPSTSFVTVLRVLAALGLAGDVDLIAAIDQEGQRLQDEHLTRPAPTRRYRMTY